MSELTKVESSQIADLETLGQANMEMQKSIAKERKEIDESS